VRACSFRNQESGLGLYEAQSAQDWFHQILLPLVLRALGGETASGSGVGDESWEEGRGTEAQRKAIIAEAQRKAIIAEAQRKAIIAEAHSDDSLPLKGKRRRCEAGLEWVELGGEWEGGHTAGGGEWEEGREREGGAWGTMNYRGVSQCDQSHFLPGRPALWTVQVDGGRRRRRICLGWAD
jgi:hypothetical protein